MSNVNKSSEKVKPYRLSKEFKAQKAQKKAVLKGVAGVPDNVIDIFKFVVLILLISMLFSVLIGTEQKTFFGFLETLQNAPQLSREVALWTPPTLGNWGVFDWLRKFLVEDLGGLLQIVTFVGASLVDVLMLCLYFLRWFFF